MKYRPKTYWDSELEEEIVSPVTMIVHEDDEAYEETGLLDQYGNPLVRVSERRPIGYKVRK